MFSWCLNPNQVVSQLFALQEHQFLSSVHKNLILQKRWSMLYMIFSIDLAGNWEGISLSKENKFFVLPCSATF